MDHPWRRLRAAADWLLHFRALPLGLMGYTDFARRIIVLDKHLLQAERRCTLAHELEHVRLGPMPTDPVLAAREEAAIDKAVARRLIDVKDLGEAMAWSQNLDEVADELWVDRSTLDARLQHLHPAERAYLLRRTRHHREEAA